MFTSIVYVLFGFIEFLLGFRFLFELLGANPANGLVAWVYSWSSPLVAPFAGIFGQHAAGQGITAQSVFDWTALVALPVYGIVGSLLGGLALRTHRAL